MAGRNVWVARCEPADRNRRLRLVSLDSLETLCGTAERGPALAALASLIRRSSDALWGMDFPFGLPVEVMDERTTWADQVEFVLCWPDTDAYELGLWCLRRARRLGGPMHVRRTTDGEAKAPFDCYHYRIIYQTFFGMRDVLGPLAGARGTAILPFHYHRAAAADRVVMECCPSSVLKRLGWPHQNYKQPAGGPLSAKRLRTRHVILDGLSSLVTFDASYRRTMMRNGGGDAIDAVLAAVGAWRGWRLTDHAAVANHPRYRREGHLYT
ncbi:MAG TPA: hypothetical protein VK324_11770 [Tepidisphaeraceae bacterium]|nr:hypothetical protein [Tepidisphaeraceae bacterium]